jgi:hypothetical protein
VGLGGKFSCFTMRSKPSRDQTAIDDATQTTTPEEETMDELHIKIGKLLKKQSPPTIGFHEFK